MNKYWFRPKRLGYGFVPVTWEGVVATLVLLGLILTSAWLNGIRKNSTTTRDEVRFALDTVILCCLFTALYKDRVEGGLRWRFWK
jgi:hypothetical protein